MVDVSVVTVNWNGKETIGECLKSLDSSQVSASVEVIVVDNDSSDGSQRMIREQFPDVRLVENDTNRGFGSACNQGIEKASGEHILLLNPDTEVTNGAIDDCLEFMERIPDAGAVGCQIRYPSGEIQPSCYNFPTLGRIIYEKVIPDSLVPYSLRKRLEIRIISWGYDEVRTFDYIMGSFLLTRSTVLDEVGTFDERYFLFAGETDLCRRMNKTGWKIYYYPYSYIKHKKGASSEKVNYAAEVQKIVSRGMFMKKHYSKPHFLSYFFLALLFNIVLWAVSEVGNNDGSLTQIYRGKSIAIVKLLDPMTDLKGKSVIEGEIILKLN